MGAPVPLLADARLAKAEAWTVAFVPAAEVACGAWWSRVLDPQARHCFAFRAIAPDCTVVVNHSGRRLVVQHLAMAAPDVARVCAVAGMTMLEVTAREQDAPALRGPMTCVEVVKALLGLRDWRVMTPRQLARRLVRNGARPVVMED